MNKVGFGFLRLPQAQNGGIDRPLWETMVDEFGFLNRLKAEGRIGKAGFSYHGDADTLDKILQAHPDVDIVQLQINYLDWDDPAMEAHKCYDIAARCGKEIVVMEPVKGGTLANLPDEAMQLLSQALPVRARHLGRSGSRSRWNKPASYLAG